MYWRRKWQPTPVFLPGKSHGQRILVGYNPWDRKRIVLDLVSEQHVYVWSVQRGSAKRNRIVQSLRMLFFVCCLVTKPCLTLLQPRGLYPSKLLCPWDFPRKNIGVGCHFLLQRIFLTQGLNPHLLHWQVDSLPLVTREALGCHG